MRGFKIISLSMIFVLLFGASLLTATDNPIVSYEGSHLWTYAYDVHISGDFAFYAKHYGLEVVDLSDPINRPIAGRLLLSDECETIEISGSYAYLGLRLGGFHIVDISNPTAPFLVGSYSIEGQTKDIYVSGDIAYISQRDDGIYLVNIANPSAPAFMSKFSTAGDPRQVAVSGDNLFIAEVDFGLEVVDVSNPTTPTLVGSFDGVGNSNGTDYQDVIVSGDYAFIADYAFSAGNDLGGFTVLDISDPANPALAFTGDLNMVYSLYLDGTTLYISTQTTGIFSFDVTVPASPTLLDHCMDQINVRHLAVYNNYLISASRNNPYFDISDPTNISLHSSNNLMFPVYSVFIDGQFAYIAQHLSGLTILDITNRDNPVLLSSIMTTGQAYEVEVINQTAYVSGRAGMDIIDVSDPANPYLLGTFLDSDSTSCEEFTIVGDLAYIAGYPANAYIVDISNPASPLLISTYTPVHISHKGVESYVPYGDYAYLCNTNLGELEILDISNPAAPVKVGSYNDLYSPMNTTILDHYALVSNSASGTLILDISDPINPILVNQIEAGSQFELGISGDYLFFGDNYGGIDIYNFTDIANPYFIGKFDTPGTARVIKSDGQYAYVADNEGFLIMALNMPNYRAGDTNNDASVNVGDAVFMINYVFKGGAAPVPIEAGDVNCDDNANVGDAVYLINFVFKNGPEPCFPQ